MGEHATAQEYAVLLTCLLRRRNQSPNLTLEVLSLPFEGYGGMLCLRRDDMWRVDSWREGQVTASEGARARDCTREACMTRVLTHVTHVSPCDTCRPPMTQYAPVTHV